MKRKFAVQLFTLREECKADFAGVLREISQIGYAGVQFAGFHGYDPAELKAWMDELGLRAAGLHYGYAALVDSPDEAAAYAKLFGTPDVVCASTGEALRTEAGYREVRAKLNELARRYADDGLRISYHNHAWEFDTTVDGMDALSYLIEPDADNRVLAEPDVYWVKRGGRDPAGFLAPYAGRVPILHLKDMTDDEERTFAPIGTGTIDFTPILRWGEASGVEWYVVEQDRCRTEPMDCVRTSYANLSALIGQLGG